MRFSASVQHDEALDSTVITLSGGLLTAKIAPTYGSNFFSFVVDGHEIFNCDKKALRERGWTGNYVLWPFPNRVRGKKYEFEGSTYSLADIKRKQGNEVLIHGLVDDEKWEFEEPCSTNNEATTTTRISIDEQSPLYRFFPFPSTLSLNYILREDHIEIGYDVANNGRRNLPFGFALHPFFNLFSGKESTFVNVPARSVMETTDDLLPTGNLLDVSAKQYKALDLRTPRPVSELNLDHVYTDLAPHEFAAIHYKTRGLGVALETSEDFTHTVVYAPPSGQFVCIENQTGSTDMINLHARALKTGDEKLKKAAHLIIVPPGETHRGFVRYRVIFK